MCTCVLISVTKWCIVGYLSAALWDICLLHCGIFVCCIVGFVRWKRHINHQPITYIKLKIRKIRKSPGGCFTNVSRALENNIAKIYNTRNHIYGENFKLALDTHTMLQLEILIRSTISAIHTFRENILESSRNVSETTPCIISWIPFH